MPVREQKLRPRQPRHAPLNFAGGQLQAAQLGLRRMPTAAAVDVAVDVDGSVPVAFEPLVPRIRLILPDDVVPARLELQQTAAGAVAFGDQDLVADYDR